MSFARPKLAVGGLLVLLTFAVYLPALSCGFIWDDDGYVINNPTLRSWDGLRQIWLDPSKTQDYYPLSFTSLWLDYRLWGLTPFGYHVHNILLHSVNVILLWRLLARLNVPGAIFAAAVFAVHPVHVESVAWITERKNVLSGLFYFLSLHAYIGFARLDADPPGGQRRWRCYFWSLGFFIPAMLSKTAVVTLPFVLPVIVWWKRGSVEWRDVLLSLPYLALVAPFFLAVFSSDANFGGAGVGIVGNARWGSTTWDFTVLERALIAGRSMWFYAWKLVWPLELSFVYPKWTIDASSWSQLAVAVAAATVPIVFWWKRRMIGRGPLAAVLFFGLTLGPASGFLNFYFQRYSFVADHLQYLASIGLIALIVAVGRRTLSQVRDIGWRPERLLAILLLVPLCVLTWNQCSIYRNLETLWRDTLAKNPNSKMAHVNLGTILLEEGLPEQAFQHYQQALGIEPDFEVANFNLGVFWHRKGNNDRAIAYFEKTLKTDPKYVEAHISWGALLVHEGRVDEAREHYRQALRIVPDYAPAYFNLGATFQQEGKIAEAMRLYRKCLDINPYDIDANYNLAVVQQQRGQFDDAAACYEMVLEVDSAHTAANFNLGVIRLDQGRFDLAAGHFRATIDREPGDAHAHHYLGQALEAMGRLAEASRHFRQAEQLQTDR